MYHGDWFQEAARVAASLDTEPSMPRLCGRQTQRANAEADSPEEYYRRNLTVNFVDTLISEMDSRFGELQKKTVLGLKLVPAVMNDGESCTPQDLEWFIEDLPSPESLNSELHLWNLKWRNHSDPPGNIQTALKDCNKQLYPNVHTVLSICSVFSCDIL